MATVVVTPTAAQDLERLIRTHSLPADTHARVSSARWRRSATIPASAPPSAGSSRAATSGGQHGRVARGIRRDDPA